MKTLLRLFKYVDQGLTPLIQNPKQCIALELFTNNDSNNIRKRGITRIPTQFCALLQNAACKNFGWRDTNFLWTQKRRVTYK